MFPMQLVMPCLRFLTEEDGLFRMDITTLRKFFGWYTIINIGFLIITILIVAIFGDTIYRTIHGPSSSISRGAFNVAIYGWIGIHRAFIIVFNLVPWIILRIIE